MPWQLRAVFFLFPSGLLLDGLAVLFWAPLSAALVYHVLADAPVVPPGARHP